MLQINIGHNVILFLKKFGSDMYTVWEVLHIAIKICILDLPGDLFQGQMDGLQ